MLLGLSDESKVDLQRHFLSSTSQLHVKNTSVEVREMTSATRETINIAGFESQNLAGGIKLEIFPLMRISKTVGLA